MKLDLSQKTSIPANVLFQQLDDETVIINLDDETFYSLDDVGTRVWQVLEEAESISAAHAQLLTEFDVEPDHLQEEMMQLIQNLLDAKLITLREA